MNPLSVNDPWTLVSLSNGCKPIVSKWIYKLNEGLQKNSKTRYNKVGTVKGFTQTQGYRLF